MQQHGRRAIAFAAGIAVLGAIGDAHALDFDDRPLIISGVVGSGTPVGLYGATIGYNVQPWLGVGVGSGTNLTGIQLAALATLRSPWRAKPEGDAPAFVLTTALSTGRWKALDLGLAGLMAGERDPNRHHYVADHAIWITIEPAFEILMVGGITLRAGGGLAWMLNRSTAYCVGDAGMQAGLRTPCVEPGKVTGSSPSDVVPTITFAVGYALKL